MRKEAIEDLEEEFIIDEEAKEEQNKSTPPKVVPKNSDNRC